jgi:hypothetical protein
MHYSRMLHGIDLDKHALDKDMQVQIKMRYEGE